MVHNAARLARLSRILGIPIISTTVVKILSYNSPQPHAASYHDGVQKFPDKALFSMLEPRIVKAFKELNRQHVVLYGVTADSCVQ